MRQAPVLAATVPYNEMEIRNAVKNITVTKSKGGQLITKNGTQVIASWSPTKIYEVVNFKDVVNSMLDVVDNIFKPLFYNLTFKAGFQELKLRGQDHKINGEIFHEMVWLTNSTDGTKKLSIRYGLMRQICSNGACITLKGTSFKVKHLKVNHVNKEMQEFMEGLPKLNVTKQVKILTKISKEEISIGKVFDALVNGTGEKGNDTIQKQLVRKLISSKTDKLGSAQDALIEGIKVPFTKMTQETLETKVPKWQVLNCYTELWRSLDASQIERETNKIMAILA